MKRILSVFILMCVVANSFAAGDRLFFISRNLNRNIIVYDVQAPNGKLNVHEPIHVYWYNHEKNPVTTNELNFIQRKMAYGYTVTSKGNNEVKVKLKAWHKREVRICKKGNEWVALVTINGKECILTEIYAHCPTKTSCDYMEIKGKAVADGSLQTEIIKG